MSLSAAPRYTRKMNGKEQTLSQTSTVIEAIEPPARRRRSNYRKDGYHHGSLDAALVKIGAALIDAEGVEAVTLRRVSGMAGVTATAAQHHFGDKEGLLGAIAAASFEELLADLTAASGPADDPEVDLDGACRAYAGFAIRRPARFQFMFEARYLDPARHSASSGLALACFDVLRKTVDRCLGRRVIGAPLFMWTLCHGVGSILGASRVPLSDRPGGSDEEVVDEIVRMALTGLRGLA